MNDLYKIYFSDVFRVQNEFVYLILLEKLLGLVEQVIFELDIG